MKTRTFAARYSQTPPSADDPYSSAGWVLSFRTAAEAERYVIESLGCGDICDAGECRRCDAARERLASGEYRVVADADGSYYVQRRGLSCFVGDGSVRDAVRIALADDRFGDGDERMPLWVFVVEHRLDDEDHGIYSYDIYRAIPSRRTRPRRVR